MENPFLFQGPIWITDRHQGRFNVRVDLVDAPGHEAVHLLCSRMRLSQPLEALQTVARLKQSFGCPGICILYVYTYLIYIPLSHLFSNVSETSSPSMSAEHSRHTFLLNMSSQKKMRHLTVVLYWWYNHILWKLDIPKFPSLVSHLAASKNPPNSRVLGFQVEPPGNGETKQPYPDNLLEMETKPTKPHKHLGAG